MGDPTNSKLAAAWQVLRLAWIGFRYHTWRVVGSAVLRDGGKHNQRTAVALGKAVTRFLRSEVTVLGAEKLESLGPYAVCANHTSYVDWALILGHFPVPPRFVARNSVAKVPVVGSYLRAQGILIDPKRGAEAQRMVAEAIEGDSPWPLLIFPEGTRSRTGEIKPFRRAGMRLLSESELPLVPLVLVGSWECFPPKASAAKMGMPMRLVIGDPIMPAGISAEERASRIEAEIRRLYAEHRPQVVAQSEAASGALAASVASDSVQGG